MKYKNSRTGVTIDVPSLISGGDWISMEEVIEKNNEPEVKENPVSDSEAIREAEGESSTTGNDDFDGITVAQIKQELTAQGIEFNPRAKKQELYDLMMG